MFIDTSLIVIAICITIIAIGILNMAIIVSKKKDEPAEEEPEFKNWNISNSIEYRELMEAYNSCNKNYYDFRLPFQHKLENGKHLTNTEIITLVGLAPTIKDKKLQKELYQILIEELVLIVTSENI